MRYHSCDNHRDLVSVGSAHQSLCCQSVPLPKSIDGVCEVCLSHSAGDRRYVCLWSQTDSFWSGLRTCCLSGGPAASVCADLQHTYSPFSQYSACCRRLPPRQPTRTLDPLLAAEGVTGLRCRTNRTLRFYLLDAALNLPLAVRLGASRNGIAGQQQQQEGGDGSFATIVDLQDEVHYVLQRSPAATLTQSLGESH